MPALHSARSPTHVAALTVSSSEAASLHGKKALTPIIAGSVSGGLLAIAWAIGFTVYFVKRYKRRKLKRAIEAGRKEPKPPKEPKAVEEPIIIPPDPAVLFGQRQPGEQVVFNKHHKHASPDVEKEKTHSSRSTRSERAIMNQSNNVSTQSFNTSTPQDSPATRPLLPSRDIQDASGE